MPKVRVAPNVQLAVAIKWDVALPHKARQDTVSDCLPDLILDIFPHQRWACSCETARPRLLRSNKSWNAIAQSMPRSQRLLSKIPPQPPILQDDSSRRRPWMKYAGPPRLGRGRSASGHNSRKAPCNSIRRCTHLRDD